MQGNGGCKTDEPVSILNDTSWPSSQVLHTDTHTYVYIYIFTEGDTAGGGVSVAGFTGAALANGAT